MCTQTSWTPWSSCWKSKTIEQKSKFRWSFGFKFTRVVLEQLDGSSHVHYSPAPTHCTTPDSVQFGYWSVLISNRRWNQCFISVHPVEKRSDIKGWRAAEPVVSVIVSVGLGGGDEIRAHKLFNMFSCIFKWQLRQLVPPQLRHTSMDDEVAEARRLQTADGLHKELHVWSLLFIYLLVCMNEHLTVCTH